MKINNLDQIRFKERDEEAILMDYYSKISGNYLLHKTQDEIFEFLENYNPTVSKDINPFWLLEHLKFEMYGGFRELLKQKFDRFIMNRLAQVPTLPPFR